jgi:amino acid transporter
MVRYCTACGSLLAPNARFCANCGAPAAARVAPQVLRRRLTLIPLVAVLFFSVSGGPYGIEDAVGRSGAGLALLLLLIVPVVWVVPVALMVAELTAAMPAEGGYYVWVKEGLGRFWGFQEGWWSWADSFLDMAIYPVLFADYLDALLSRYANISLVDDNRWVHWAVALAVIWVFAWLNIRGVRPVGNSSVLFTLVVLAPFVVLVYLGLSHFGAHPTAVWRPFLPPHTPALNALGLGLFVVLWNYLGWDGPSTVSGEIVRPRSTYPWSLAVSVPLVVATYVLPVAAGLTAVGAVAAWKDGAFPAIAAAVGGNWLGLWVALAGLVSAAGLFSALLLSNSRLPFVLADDGYLPQRLTRLHARFSTPWIAILVCAAIYSLFTLDAFADLVELDVIVYTAGLLLEFAALIALRRRQPGLARPFRVPGGAAGLALVTAAPALVFVVALAGTVAQRGPRALALPAAILLSGIVLYPVLGRLFHAKRA